jgi:hypothetical protein
LIEFTGGIRLRVFLAGGCGEFWRILKKGDLKSHFVCRGKFTTDEDGFDPSALGEITL